MLPVWCNVFDTIYTSSVFILYFVSLHLAYCIDGNGCSYSTGHQISFNSYITLNRHYSGYEKRRKKNLSSLIRSPSTVGSTIGRTDNCVAAFKREWLDWIIFSRSCLVEYLHNIIYSRSNINVFYRWCSSLLIWQSFKNQF